MENYNNFTPEDFDLDLLLNFRNKILIESSNFSTIKQICNETLKFSRMCAIVAEPGYGKSIALEHFVGENKNIHYMAVKKTMSTKDFYNKILEAAGWSNRYRSSSLYSIIESIGYYLAQSSGKHLIIIDEAGKLNHKQRLCLHDLRDAVKNNTGIILAGPKYFQNEILAQKKNDIEGIPELLRRIDMFIELQPPTTIEKRELFKLNGFRNQSLINSVLKNCVHLGDVYNVVENFAILALRMQDNVE
ncbi:MAG: hypothetical protein JWR76_372 [Mucilaginibacter sp.]|nr:hypothetical protein [Mucilaginibacter sp.]